eukprot:gene13662-16509_t
MPFGSGADAKVSQWPFYESGRPCTAPAPHPVKPQRRPKHVPKLAAVADMPAGLHKLDKAEPAREITILHFNDVYEIEASVAKAGKPPRGAAEGEPYVCGGASRFTQRLKELKAQTNASVIFSGDAFNPSMLSTVTKGKHMVPVLNEMMIDAATIGNHDFDFGVENLMTHVEATNFPWMLANAHDKATGKPLGAGVPTCVIENSGRRIGLIGLIEREWLATLATIDEEDTVYEDFVVCARRLAAELRATENVDLVVAVTHMRVPNDERLAREVPELDLILDFRDVTEVTIADKIFPVGLLTYRDLVSLLPMLDELMVLGLSGEQVVEALENGVSQYPKLEGRFPQVSGGVPMVADKEYSVAVKAYLALGKDGYTVFTKESAAMLWRQKVHEHQHADSADSAAASPADGAAAASASLTQKKSNFKYKLRPAVEGRTVCIQASLEDESDSASINGCISWNRPRRYLCTLAIQQQQQQLVLVAFYNLLAGGMLALPTPPPTATPLPAGGVNSTTTASARAGHDCTIFSWFVAAASWFIALTEATIMQASSSDRSSHTPSEAAIMNSSFLKSRTVT